MIRYRKRRYWKYLLEDPFTYPVGNLPDCKVPFLELADGHLIFESGYAWDGASGPTIDSKKTMKPSLVHDGLYQLMREGLLTTTAKPAADKIFYDMLRDNGVWGVRARVWYRAVKIGGPTSRYVLEAP